nr:unnamed protein product [Digitaria exilis]
MGVPSRAQRRVGRLPPFPLPLPHSTAGNGHELGVCSSDRASDADGPRAVEEWEERALKHSGLSEACLDSQEIKEVFEDGFSEESRHITRMTTSPELDGSSEKHKKLRETPMDCFLEELNTEEFGTSLGSAKLLDVPYGEEFIGNRVEMSVLRSLEILEFIDKHDTAKIVADGSDFVTAEVPSSDDSVHHDIGKEHRKEIEQEQSKAGLSLNIVLDRLPEGILDEWQETQNLVIERNKKLPEDDSTGEDGKQAVGVSDEAHDSLCDPTVFPLDSVSEKESETVTASNNQATSDQDGELEKEISRNKTVESSTSASSVRDFANNHWRIIEQLDSFANEESIHREGSPENLALETAEDEDRDDNCTSTVNFQRSPGKD